MKKKILIVDDEPAIVSYLEMVLQDQGFDTLTAGNGNEALEAVRKNRPDLVTLDITMPEASGTRFYKEMRTDPELSQIPVIIVTAVTGLGGDKYAYEKFISNRRLVPAPEAFFPKPIDREAFIQAVNGLLAA
ncbi:MAG: response regulator [Gemmatimonadetes bacterium]|nr:response regulator [Gemmatimonadota bacterium]